MQKNGFTEETLLATLRRYGKIAPRTLRKAALARLAKAKTNQNSFPAIAFGICVRLSEVAAELEAEGRIYKNRREDYFALCYRNFDKKKGFSAAFMRAENKLFSEDDLLKDTEKWKEDFTIFGSKAETVDDVNKGIAAIRTLRAVHQYRSVFFKIGNALFHANREKKAIDSLLALLYQTERLSREEIDVALSAKTNPVFDKNNLTMPNPAHVACVEELEALFAPSVSPADPPKSPLPDQGEPEETDEEKKAREERERLREAVAFKRILVTALDEPFAFTPEETVKIPRLRMDCMIALTLQKTEAMTKAQKEAFFERIKTADEALYLCLTKASEDKEE